MDGLYQRPPQKPKQKLGFAQPAGRGMRAAHSGYYGYRAARVRGFFSAAFERDGLRTSAFPESGFSRVRRSR
jgi:hypothetical protein